MVKFEGIKVPYVAYIIFALLMGFASLPANANDWTPKNTVEISVGSSAGSGTDATARMIQRLLQEKKMLDVPVVVANKPGGGSAIVMAYMAQRKGDPHYLNIAAYNLVTNKITGKTNLGISDYTPLALLFSDYIAFNVKPDSPFKSAKSLIDQMRKDPQSVSFGLSSSVGGANHIALALVMKAAGIDIRQLKVVVFNSGGETSTAVLGGHVDVQVTSASVVPNLLTSKKIRVLAVSSPRRLSGVMSVAPTWAEHGIPVTASNWRIALAPKDITESQIAFWDQTFRKLTELKEWGEYLEKSFSDNAYLDSKSTKQYLDDEQKRVSAILHELGLAK